jgi:hypothetical protein
MRRLFVVITLLFLLFSYNLLNAAEANWSSVRAIVKGYRDINALVENIVTIVNTYNPSPGSTLRITGGLDAYDFDQLAVKLSNGTGGHEYFLEVWTQRGGTWIKGMEYSYDDEYSGMIIFKPFAFDSVNYSEGSLHRIVFSHTASRREMTVYSAHSPAVSSIEKSIGTASEEGGYVDLYFTAHLNTNLAGTAANDAYLFGARIKTASPYYCTAKQGVHDQGAAYDFTAYGVAHGFNAGLFQNTGPGFVNDGQSGGGNYPLESEVTPVNLPTAAMVNAVTVAFQSEAGPSFM